MCKGGNQILLFKTQPQGWKLEPNIRPRCTNGGVCTPSWTALLLNETHQHTHCTSSYGHRKDQKLASPNELVL